MLGAIFGGVLGGIGIGAGDLEDALLVTGGDLNLAVLVAGHDIAHDPNAAGIPQYGGTAREQRR